MRALVAVGLLSACFGQTAAASEMHDESPVNLVLADRLEYFEAGDEWIWDIQGYAGYDEHKFWWKTEGGGDDAELQFLYSRAVSAFFDLQLGLRHDFEPDPSRSFATLGVQGLAPYWFEIDAALFIADDGRLSARFEAEYELLLNQRLVLQPRVELVVGASDEARYAQGSGLRSTDVGLRLRYEIRRELAPYIGVEWHKLHGGTADHARNAGEDAHGASAVAGLRFWF
ncbi:MAG: copper resistance protein B [Woeseiaceae bacterium]